MPQRQSVTLYNNANVLGSDVYIAAHAARLAAAQAFSVGADGFLSLRILVDNGGGGAPNDTPVGAWELYAGDDATGYTKVSDADVKLQPLNPSGNAKIEGFAIFDGVPGAKAKVVYLRSSGGGGNSRLTLVASVNL